MRIDQVLEELLQKPLREKIGYKAGQAVLLLDLPDGCADPFDGVEHRTAKGRTTKLARRNFDLVLAFTRDRAALKGAAKVLLGLLAQGAKVWLAYPKKTGAIRTDLYRDSGWAPLFDAGYTVVAIAAVDATWSAVRFRSQRRIKSTQLRETHDGTAVRITT